MKFQLRTALLLVGIAASVAVSAQQNELAWTMERAVKQLDRQGSDLETVLADVDLSGIQIWIDEALWLPARQVISQAAGGQTLTVTYRGTARNLDLNRDLFNDKWPRGSKKERM